MSSSSSYALGHYSTDNFTQAGIGIFTGLLSCTLNLYNIVSTYFLWFNKRFLFARSILIPFSHTDGCRTSHISFTETYSIPRVFLPEQTRVHAPWVSVTTPQITHVLQVDELEIDETFLA